MKNQRKFLKCDHCGNMVGIIEDSGVEMVCCGQPMTVLVVNTTDAAQEKHVPVAAREGGRLNVTVGSVAHPMLAEHHIAWIAVAQGEKTQRENLDRTGSPTAEFCVEEGPVTVYAYCNLHGLWSAEL